MNFVETRNNCARVGSVLGNDLFDLLRYYHCEPASYITALSVDLFFNMNSTGQTESSPAIIEKAPGKKKKYLNSISAITTRLRLIGIKSLAVGTGYLTLNADNCHSKTATSINTKIIVIPYPS
jgi:hypothetical protein